MQFSVRNILKITGNMAEQLNWQCRIQGT